MGFSVTDQIKSQDYRQRAALMRLQAEHTLSARGRFVYQELATYWDQMADMADNALRLRDAIEGDSNAQMEEAALYWPPRRHDVDSRIDLREGLSFH